MKIRHASLPVLLIGLLACLPIAWTGCNKASAVDAEEIEKYRLNFALQEEPDGALAVVEVREQLLDASGRDHDHDAHDHNHDAHDENAGEHAHHEAEHADHDHEAHGDEDADEGHEHADHAHDHGDEHGEHDHSADLPDDEEDEQTLRVETISREHDDIEHELNGDGHDEHAEHDHGAADHVCGPECAGCAACSESQCSLCSEGQEVVMVGMVGGLPNAAKETQPDFPFVKGYAIIMIADPLAVAEFDGGGHNHAPGEECAFCAAHAADSSAMLATVKFSDENGKVLPVDARNLFDLKERETVVVRGKARLDQDGMLVVDANGLYVRR